MLEAGLMTGDLLSYTRILGVRNPFSFHVAKYLRNKTKRLQSISNPNSWINKLPDEERDRYIREMNDAINNPFQQGQGSAAGFAMGGKRRRKKRTKKKSRKTRKKRKKKTKKRRKKRKRKKRKTRR